MNNFQKQEKDPILHIHAQGHEHDEAYIVGTTTALARLRDAIDRALNGEVDSTSIAFASDGEGYEIYIITEDNPHMWNQLQLPYVNAEWHNPNRGMHPAELILKDMSQEVNQQWENWKHNE